MEGDLDKHEITERERETHEHDIARHSRQGSNVCTVMYPSGILPQMDQLGIQIRSRLQLRQ